MHALSGSSSSQTAFSAPTAFLSSSKEAGPGKMGRGAVVQLIGTSETAVTSTSTPYGFCGDQGADDRLSRFEMDTRGGCMKLAPRLQVRGGGGSSPTHIGLDDLLHCCNAAMLQVFQNSLDSLDSLESLPGAPKKANKSTKDEERALAGCGRWEGALMTA